MLDVDREDLQEFFELQVAKLCEFLKKFQNDSKIPKKVIRLVKRQLYLIKDIYTNLKEDNILIFQLGEFFLNQKLIVTYCDHLNIDAPQQDSDLPEAIDWIKEDLDISDYLGDSNSILNSNLPVLTTTDKQEMLQQMREMDFRTQLGGHKELLALDELNGIFSMLLSQLEIYLNSLNLPNAISKIQNIKQFINQASVLDDDYLLKIAANVGGEIIELKKLPNFPSDLKQNPAFKLISLISNQFQFLISMLPDFAKHTTSNKTQDIMCAFAANLKIENSLLTQLHLPMLSLTFTEKEVNISAPLNRTELNSHRNGLFQPAKSIIADNQSVRLACTK